jgi:hypothetical protein
VLCGGVKWKGDRSDLRTDVTLTTASFWSLL